MESDLVVDGKKLFFGNREFRCAVGKNGISSEKREGDGITASGKFALRSVLFRGDRIKQPATSLPLSEIHKEDGWCDDPKDPAYNTRIALPYPARYEKLWREDGIYDLLVIIGYNDDPPEPGLGSAIFLHVARPGYEPTEGCVAVSLDDLLYIVNSLNSSSTITILD